LELRWNSTKLGILFVGTDVPNRSTTFLIYSSITAICCEKMNSKKMVVALLVAVLLLPALPYAFSDTLTITVSTDKQYYNPGATVKITGTALVRNVNLKISIESNTVLEKIISTASDGKYSFDYNLPPNPERGTYTVNTKSAVDSSEASTTFIVLNAATSEIAQNMIDIAKAAKTTTNNKLNSGGTIPRPAQENYDQGEAALNQAKQLYADGNFQAAIEAARRAQTHFNNAIKIMFREHPEKDIKDENLELGEKLDRAYALLNRLNANFQEMKDDIDPDLVTEITDELKDAKESLDAAKASLDASQLGAAEASLESGQGHLEKVIDLLKDEAHENEGKAADNFIDKTIKRIEKLKEALTSAKSQLPAGKADAVIVDLNKIEQSLQDIQQKIMAGNIDIEAINNEIKDIQKALEAVGDTIYSDMLKELNELHAWIQVMKDAEIWRMKKGLSIDDLGKKINDCNAILGSYMSEMAKGHKGSMRSSFAEIVHDFQQKYGRGNNKDDR
jgi:tetratricopeptide (TPR) repeat protein